MKESIKILNCYCEEEAEHFYLSWFKRLICKIFKIKPEKKYWYKFSIRVSSGYYRLGDVILLQDDERFIVTDIKGKNSDSGILIVQSIGSTDKIKSLHGEFVVLANMFCPGTGQPG